MIDKLKEPMNEPISPVAEAVRLLRDNAEAIRLKLVRGAFGSGIGLHIRQWDNLGGLGVGTHVLFKKTAPGDAS